MDTQDLLLVMRKEQREDIQALGKTVDAGFRTVTEQLDLHEKSDIRLFAAIDKRVSTIESTRKALIWLIGVTLVAVIGAYANQHFATKEDQPHATELSHPAETRVP